MTVKRSYENCIGSASPSGGGSAPVIQELNVTPSTSAQTITAPEGVDGFSPVNVPAVQLPDVWHDWKSVSSSANFTENGTPTITDGVLTIPTDNTGTKIYASTALPQITQSDTIEVVVKLKRDALESSLNEELIELWANGTTMNYMGTRAFSLWAKNNGGYSWQENVGGSVTVTGSQANTWFYIKFNASYENGGWNMSACSSDDGKTWGTASTYTTYSSFNFTKKNILIGCHLQTKTSSTFIDLNECYVKVNDTIVWTPYTVTTKNCYTLTDTPTTSTQVYEIPKKTSALTITSIGSGTITLSDTNVYSRNSAGDVESPVLGVKTITANGTYDPADDYLDGYSSVVVNVS